MPSVRADLMQVQLIAMGQMETEMHKQPIFEEDAFCSLQATRCTLKDRALCAESRQPQDLMRFEERHRTPPPSNRFGLVPRTSGHPIAFFFKKNPIDTFSQHTADCQQMSCNCWHQGASEALACAAALQPDPAPAPCHAGCAAAETSHRDPAFPLQTGERARVGGKGLVLRCGWLRV